MKKLIYALCITPYALAAQAGLIDMNVPKTIVAEKVEYDVRTRSVQTKGDTTVSNETGQRMTLRDAYMDETGLRAGGGNLDLILGYRTRVTARTLHKDAHITTAEDATYTACYACDVDVNAWEISASEFRHDNEAHLMHFDNPVFWAYGLPIFWAPYLSYPDPTIKRKSGLLMPYMNTTNQMGTQFNFPLYLAFSDYHDATLTSSYLTAENPLFQLEHRLNYDRSSFRTTGSFTKNREGDERWHIFNKDLIEMGDNVRANVFVERTSDKLYLQKYGFYDSRPYLDSGARVEVFGESAYVVADAHIFQELRSTPYSNVSNPSGDILPNIRGTLQSDPFWMDTYFTLTGDIIGISNMDNNAAAQRMLGIARVTSPWTIWLGQKLTLSASVRYDVYHFMNTDMLDGTTDFTGVRARFLPSGYADWSWPFMKSGDDWIHVVEPRVRVTVKNTLDSPAFANIDSSGSLLSDATLFADNRLSGYDLWENGSYIDYGMGWTAYSNDAITLSAFAGQSYDFAPPIDLDPNSGFHDGASDYVGRLSADYRGLLSVNNRFRFAQRDLTLRHLESVGKIGGRNYVEVGYIRATQLLDAVTIDKVNNEIVGGFGIGFTERLSLQARTIYNVTDNRIQQQSASLYYDHPCYIVQLGYSKDGAVRYNVDGSNYVGRTTFHLRFALKITETK
ncbi:MAG: LPS assembly protein LptD [Alphaproteobacteria bacterium]|nr:LPS assembly protein LptD [Alphaproteobacteria bacterium]MCL2889733.1 LPS assembly protein LptD [Alphaproteobacteria bacterium]